MLFKVILFLLSLFMGIAGYSQKLYKPTLADAQRTGIHADTLMMGRKQYINNCGSCHALYMPGQYSKEEWENVLYRMQKKAKITDQQAKTILNYLKSGAGEKTGITIKSSQMASEHQK
jgi:mono/diheme cytochrome c family protein